MLFVRGEWEQIGSPVSPPSQLQGACSGCRPQPNPAQPSPARLTLSPLFPPHPIPPHKTSVSVAEDPARDVLAGLGAEQRGRVPSRLGGAELRPLVVVSWSALEEGETVVPTCQVCSLALEQVPAGPREAVLMYSTASAGSPGLLILLGLGVVPLIGLSKALRWAEEGSRECGRLCLGASSN